MVELNEKAAVPAGPPARTRTERLRTDFIDTMGGIAQQEGLSPIAGRIIGLMVFDGHVYAFGDLAIALRVSRASISTNARFLVEQGVLERIQRPGDRRDYYRLVPDGLSAMLLGVERRARTAAGRIAATASALEEGDEARAARLEGLARFYATLADALGAAVRQGASEEGDRDAR